MCTAQVKRAHAQQPANKSIGQNIFPILRSRKKKKRIRSRLRCIWHTGLYVFPNLGEIKLQTQKYVVSFSELHHQPEHCLIASSQLTCLFNDYLIFKHSISLVRFFFISCFARGARCFVLLFGVCVFQSTRVDRWKWTERRRYVTTCIEFPSTILSPFLPFQRLLWNNTIFSFFFVMNIDV